MTKRGRIILISLVAVLVLSSTLFAQQRGPARNRDQTQRIYMDILRAERYNPQVNRDGDIEFKVGRDDYTLSIDRSNPQFFEFYTVINYRDNRRIADQQIIEAANYANTRVDVAKVYFNLDRRLVYFNIQTFLAEPDDLKPIFSKFMSAIRDSQAAFNSRLR